MRRILALRLSWIIGGLLVVLGAIFVVLLLEQPDNAQAEYQITRLYQTAAMLSTRTASVVAGNSQETAQPTLAELERTAIGQETNTPAQRPSLDPIVLRTATPPASADSALPEVDCNRASAGNPIDITVPDETQFLPGQAFTKIWRLHNEGSCTWTKDYTARFLFGDRMSAPEIVFLDRDVSPGGEIEIAVDMQAPNEPGSYQGNWKLSDANGDLFGIGPRSDAPFWVKVVVLYADKPTQTPTESPTSTATQTPTATFTPTPTSTPPVKSSASLVLKVSQFVDLDTGSVIPADGQDIAYNLEGDFHLFIPQPGALVGVSGSQEPGPETCLASGLSPASIAVESLTPGAYLCYKTDENMPGWLRYDALNIQDGSVSLVFRTWLLP